MFAEMSVVELLSHLRDEPARRTQIVAEYDACNAPFSPEPWFEEWATSSFDRGAEIGGVDWLDLIEESFYDWIEGFYDVCDRAGLDDPTTSKLFPVGDDHRRGFGNLCHDPYYWDSLFDNHILDQMEGVMFSERDDVFYFEGDPVPFGDWRDGGFRHDTYWGSFDDRLDSYIDFWNFSPYDDYRDDYFDQMEELLRRGAHR